ncbi:MAG: Helix-turn-helix domain [Thermomicrobiales bacterium]|nr:Helix-turn-helix domain [Thermomicrobiales bacterium]
MLSDATGMLAPARGADDNVYTMGEAARLKGVSYHTVSRAVRRGVLPAQRIGKMVFITKADLLAWHPKYDRAPMQYRHRTPVPDAKPAMIDLASSDRVQLAGHLAALLEIAEVTGRELPIDTTLGLICERLATALELRRVAIWGTDRDQGVATLLAGYGTPLAELPELIRLKEHPQFAGIIRKADGAVVVDVKAHRLRIPAPFRHLPSLLVVPLRYGERAFGYLLADRNGVGFTLSAEELRFARGLASHGAMALALAEAREAGLLKAATGKARLPRAASA